jgi:hypothetical protein
MEMKQQNAKAAVTNANEASAWEEMTRLTGAVIRQRTTTL